MKFIAFTAAAALILAVPAIAQAPQSERIGQFDKTNSGQPIQLPEGPAQVTVTKVTIPAGGKLAPHKHPFQRYGYVESGAIKVTNLDTGGVVDYRAGQVIIEARGQWHMGEVTGDAPVVLIVFDQTPPGEGNVVMKP